MGKGIKVGSPLNTSEMGSGGDSGGLFYLSKRLSIEEIKLKKKKGTQQNHKASQKLGDKKVVQKTTPREQTPFLAYSNFTVTKNKPHTVFG